MELGNGRIDFPALYWQQARSNRDAAMMPIWTKLGVLSRLGKLSGASDKSAIAGTHHAKGPSLMRVKWSHGWAARA